MYRVLGVLAGVLISGFVAALLMALLSAPAPVAIAVLLIFCLGGSALSMAAIYSSKLHEKIHINCPNPLECIAKGNYPP